MPQGPRPTLASLAFPILIHVWPLLLVVSQKALVPLGLLALDYGRSGARRDLSIALLMLLAAGATLLLQPETGHAIEHYVGYALFVLSVPVINFAIRQSRDTVLVWIGYLTVFNAALAIVAYTFEIDMGGLRGLNRIVDAEGNAGRVYFETTSLIAVFSAAFVRPRWLGSLSFLVVAFYAVYLGKSVFVILLYFANRYIHLIVRGSALQQVAFIGLAIFLAVAGPLTVAILRPDFALSLGVKLLQFSRILTDSASVWFGGGWGYVIDEIITSSAQPYQVEMQLPMLMAQIGLVQVLLYAACMYYLLKSISRTKTALWLRLGAYLLIGFSNPWLFIPSWYLTVALLYDRLEREDNEAARNTLLAQR